MKAMFTTFGIPDLVISDNGPQYTSRKFKDFARTWGFSHRTSNPYSAQENGMAERAVQSAKQILKLEDPELGLLNYRSTVHSAIGVSPAVALMGRQIQTRLPILTKQLLLQSPKPDEIQKSDKAAKQSYKDYYDSRHGVRPLSTLSQGQTVRTKLDSESEWSKPGEIIRGIVITSCICCRLKMV